MFIYFHENLSQVFLLLWNNFFYTLFHHRIFSVIPFLRYTKNVNLIKHTLAKELVRIFKLCIRGFFCDSFFNLNNWNIIYPRLIHEFRFMFSFFSLLVKNTNGIDDEARNNDVQCINVLWMHYKRRNDNIFQFGYVRYFWACIRRYIRTRATINTTVPITFEQIIMNCRQPISIIHTQTYHKKHHINRAQHHHRQNTPHLFNILIDVYSTMMEPFAVQRTHTLREFCAW